jgi:hypothetical protein
MALRRGGREFPDPFAFRLETAFREEARYYGKTAARARVFGGVLSFSQEGDHFL